ncbi:hypothetical protein N9Q41_01410 [Amylibacter sp.]|nr:hypothetical protein [Amylibacter sp.]
MSKGNKMQSANYTYSTEKVIEDLKLVGFSKLPSVKDLVQRSSYLEILKQEGDLKTYKENSLAHLKLIQDMGLEHLFDALYRHGKELHLKIDQEDKYFISRYVTSGQVTEGYRGHFDSHFITIVIPVVIPTAEELYTNGELLAAPNFRGHISSELTNIFQKVYFKKLNSKKTYIELIKGDKAHLFNFMDYEPLIFYGNRTFHGNFPLGRSTSDRLTFLCHLYDTSPRFGIGNILRKLRKR